MLTSHAKTLPAKPSRTTLAVLAESSLFRLLVVTLALLVLMGSLNGSRFLSYRNFASMCFQFPELGVFSLAIMVSLITGGIDLSIISIANLAGLAAGLVLAHSSANSTRILPAILLALVVSILCGLLNGWLIGYLRITPILATLGTMQLLMGIAFALTKGHAVAGYPDAFQTLGNGTLFHVPVPLVLFLLCALALQILLSRTTLGIRLCMMGTNPTAAVFAGLHVPRLQVKTYVLSALLAGIAGLIVIARTNSAKADYGTSYLLQAVLVAILAGVDPRGGFGTVWGILLAVLSLQFLSSGLNLLQFHEFAGPYINNFTKEFTWGALLLLVMALHRRIGRRR
ncbi:MAG: ABC transporter permease [Planctomycetes bacterium]|nr:ABC transporter permease [Planctomycetota bacterium]